MKILLVDTALEWRGGQSQFFYTARGLAALGHSALLACRRGGTLETRARAEGLAIHPLRFRGDFCPPAILGLVRIIRSWHPDVIQLNDPHAVANGLIASRLATPPSRRPRVVAMRRVDFHLRGVPSRFKFAACDRVIVVSRAIHQVLREDGILAERLRLVYEGVPDRLPQPGGAEALAALGVPGGSPVVGVVAALTPHKDHATFLEAAARVRQRIPEARFVLVGNGELRATLETRAASLSLDGRCLFTGFRTDLDRLIPSFAVFCLSSRWEGLGTSLLDAMCFSRPIVATAAGGIPEAVEDGVTGRIVPVGSPDALADALVKVLEDGPAREAMGRAGRLRFERHFTDRRMVEETLAVCEELG